MAIGESVGKQIVAPAILELTIGSAGVALGAKPLADLCYIGADALFLAIMGCGVSF
jgi:hypothetical protein